MSSMQLMFISMHLRDTLYIGLQLSKINFTAREKPLL